MGAVTGGGGYCEIALLRFNKRAELPYLVREKLLRSGMSAGSRFRYNSIRPSNKKGTGSELAHDNTVKNDGREVPVPFLLDALRKKPAVPPCPFPVRYEYVR